jgi:trans-2-enoyl-CoA reductase
MPRYFFHFASNDEFILDHDGVVLDDLEAAHTHAMRLIWQTVAVMGGEDFRQWRVEIAEESQGVVLTVLFPSVPTVARPPFGQQEHSTFVPSVAIQG